MASQHGEIFVGRQGEMERLVGALDDVFSGRGRLVMLAGEPGIGKTRLAHELTVMAEARGAIVLWGWCHERRGAPPYWPWLQFIRAYLETAEASQLRQDMGQGAADISEILPELTFKIEGLEKPPVLDQEPARFRLFFSITTFLKNVSRRQPLVLILDDLHWADESSLLLLEFLAREISVNSVMVLGTYRDNEVTRGHPLAQTLGSLVREENFQRVQLGGLSRQEVGEFVEARARVAIADATVYSLHQRTEGNPLFVGEVVSSVSPEEMAQDQTWIASIPEAVREAILRRLSRLSDPCNQLLRTASVVGREFDLPLLRALMPEIAEDEFLQSVDEALSIRIVESLPVGSGGYRFGHALIQQAVYEEISPMQKALAHALTGKTLEELHQRNLYEHAGELAHHFAEAKTVVGSEKLARYSLMAGEWALATYANEDALAHFERGLVARNITSSGKKAAPDEEAADLLFGLARAQSATVEGHQLAEAFVLLSRAFEYYAEAGNVAQAVAAAEFPIAPPAYLIPGVAQLMARALNLVPADSHEAGRLLSRYGGTLGVAECDYEGAQQALGQAIAIARREGDVPLEVQTLIYAAVVSGIHLHWQESVDNGLRAIELATGDENPFSEFISRWWAAVGLLHMGDLDAARPHALVLRDLAERRSTPRLHASVSLVPITSLYCLEGDWAAGREYSGRGLELSPLNAHLLGPRVMLEHETGESAQREVYIDRLLEAMRGRTDPFSSGRTSMVITAVARTTGVPDRLEIAEFEAEAVLSEQTVTPGRAIFAKAGLALLAVHKGDQSAVVEHYAFLLGHRSTMIWTVASVDRLLGLLSQTMGNLDQATVHFEDALDFCRKAGYRPELAWSCCDYADMLLDPSTSSGRAVSDNRAKAMSLLNESLTISTELGMRPLMERVTGLRAQAEAQPAQRPLYPDGLTQREVEVIRLIAVGKTDREIAGELVISINTVYNHVKNILNKTNAANRTEAASYATRIGLTGDADILGDRG